MGGQSTPKPQLLEIPGTEGANGGNNQAVDFLINLMNQEAPKQNVPGAQQIPGLNVAGLTGNEQTTQNLLGKYLKTDPTQGEAYKLGMGEISKTLGGEFYDPKTSDFWKGYRDYSGMQEEKGVSDIRRRGQLGGGLYGEPNMRQESDYRQGSQAQRNMVLGGLFDKERDRKSNAANQALSYANFGEQSKLNRLNTGATVGAIPRNVQNQKYQAKYNQQLGQSNADYATAQQQSKADYASQLFPYTVQSGIAQQLMPQWYAPGQQNNNSMGLGMLGLLGKVIENPK